MELKSRHCQKSESLQVVFQDIKQLMALAFLGQSGSMAEITAVDVFVNSFTDRNLHKQVLQKAEALTWAVRIEAIDDRAKHDVLS